jgi:hypothetical protein
MHEIITSFCMKVVLHEVRTLCHRFAGGFSIISTTFILILYNIQCPGNISSSVDAKSHELFPQTADS